MLAEKQPKGWTVSTLGDIARKDGYGLVDGPFGSNLPASEYIPFGVPVIRGSNLSLGKKRFVDDEFVFVSPQFAKRLERSIAKPDDIIFTKKGTLGQTGIVPHSLPYKQYLTSSNQMKLSVDEEIALPLFVYYYVSSSASREKVIQDSEATGVPKTNLTYLRTFPILLPPLSEQRTIARILGALDDKIEVNRRMNATLESMARVVFCQWFTENPDLTNWELSRIGDLGNLDKGVSYKGAFLTEEGMPMINLGCFQGKGKFKIENLKTYSGEYKERHTVKPGDIVLANTDITQKREVIGSPAIVPDYPAKEYLFTHHTYALRVTDNSPVLKNYLYFTLLQEEFRERAEGFATGTTVLALPRDAVLDYEISMPPADLLQKFYEQVHPMLEKVQSNIKESRTLGSLRDSLLPKLMRGEVRVKDL